MDLNRDVIQLGSEEIPKETVALIILGFLAVLVLGFRAIVIAPRTRKLAQYSQAQAIKPAKEPVYYYTKIKSQLERPITKRQKRNWDYQYEMYPERSSSYKYDSSSFYNPTKAPSYRYEPNYYFETFTPYDLVKRRRQKDYYTTSSSSSRPSSKKKRKYLKYDSDFDSHSIKYEDPYKLNEFREILHDIRDLLSDTKPQASDRRYDVYMPPAVSKPSSLKWYEWLFPLLAITATVAFLAETYMKLPQIPDARVRTSEAQKVLQQVIDVFTNEIQVWKRNYRN
ncbi:uncharacterized protein LOC136029511 [Artemia franciscana]|uniref:Uncharacterized protein n=1 Tax=Artemia franciscana TaxID=6661 RepID=A0AA88H8M2_ARTSF|nr:hypothetical protein QYM36_014826 [Artemia franciscana]